MIPNILGDKRARVSSSGSYIRIPTVTWLAFLLSGVLESLVSLILGTLTTYHLR